LAYSHASDSLLIGTYGGTKATLDSSGNLGLGVTPSASGSAAAKVFFINNGALYGFASGSTIVNGFASNTYGFGGTQYYQVTGAAASAYVQTSGQHQFFTAASGTAGNAITFTQAMTLDASGNLLVARTSANSLFPGIQVGSTTNGKNILITSSSAGNNGLLQFKDTADADAFQISATTTEIGLYGYGSRYMKFSTNEIERARIDSSGNLLVGTTSSTGNGGKSQVVRTDAGACLYLETNNSSGSQNVLDITNAANAGMSNMIRFWVNGYGNTQVGSITATTTSTAYNTSSDYRLKENQQALTGSGAFIDALKPKTWNWKSNGEKGVGFIAHEVQEVSPNSVVGEKDGEQMQAMEYGSAEFIANIIAELQSLRARVAALES